jgi:hypothetical protein
MEVVTPLHLNYGYRLRIFTPRVQRVKIDPRHGITSICLARWAERGGLRPPRFDWMRGPEGVSGRSGGGARLGGITVATIVSLSTCPGKPTEKPLLGFIFIIQGRDKRRRYVERYSMSAHPRVLLEHSVQLVLRENRSTLQRGLKVPSKPRPVSTSVPALVNLRLGPQISVHTKQISPVTDICMQNFHQAIMHCVKQLCAGGFRCRHILQ